ncbi:beta-ketoacyl synthase N-terminal-like domain-containing protein [Streptomyces alboniger]|uniref:3-oxoacyl-ACP synthase n=1 Tax=Streptomyces alboniger TaxID=132473 RepID=A0A5J6HL84_STRAD|nr:beta-ketoacyl synthase N-terminal-like domain-containing protein [Streptomyces alboniger]QEV19972.1 3-oxoacyl-ACP synthase [Streptomyces alboniger]
MTGIRPVITAWSAISPFGFGADAFRAGLRGGVPAAAPGAGAARLVPDFDGRAVLGKKGTRSMDRVTALSVAAVRELVDRPDAPAAPAGGPAPGLVLGTTGSVQSTMDFTRSSLDGERPFYVDAARFPNTVMNCAAGQCAIWHGLKGPNATVAGGRAAGLLALNYARRLQAGGRAGTLYCGGAEEYSDARAHLHQHAQGTPGTPGTAVLGEGAAVLRLEPGGSGADGAAERDGLAEVVALEFGVYEDAGEIPATLLRCLRRVLERAGARPEDVALVAPGAAEGPEQEALSALFGHRPPAQTDCAALIGDQAAAAAAFQVLTVLVRAEEDPALAGRLALVTAVDHDGTLGCALLRPYPAR